MTNNSNYNLVIFDLDGTLLDTLPDIAAAANEVLAAIGAPVYPLSDYCTLVGSGVAMLFQRALPEHRVSEPLVAECIERFTKSYAEKWNVHTKRFDGITDLLDVLVDRGVKLAVLSNKPDAFAKKCVAEYLGDYPFDPVFGQREGVPRKPDPAAAIEIAGRLGVGHRQALYVGDTAVDMQTAKGANMFAVGVSWGYRSDEELLENGAAVLIERPLDLLDIFKKP